MGSHRAAGQLQQRPAPAEGLIFNPRTFSWYPPDQPPDHFDSILISCDLAFTATETSDYVVCQVWGKHGPNAYLLRQTRLSFTQTVLVHDCGDGGPRACHARGSVQPSGARHEAEATWP